MNCDPLARWYRWLEYAGFGRALERTRLAFLDTATTARRVLVLGDGDGRFLAALLKANPHAEADYVDSSAKMLAQAQQRLGAADAVRVRFHHADAVHWQPSTAGYDLIVTHFFLDCFTDGEVYPLVARLAAFTAPGARWLVSEFRQPSGGPAAWHAWLWITGLYAFFRAATGLRVRRLPNHAAALTAAGFRLERETVTRFGLLTSQAWRRDPPGFCV